MNNDAQQQLSTYKASNLEAFPLLHETSEGVENEHPELTALKPAQQRQQIEKHPSEVLDINDDLNYYSYGWMKEPELESQTNYIALGTFIGVTSLCIYFLIGTRLLNFIHFFLVKKQYRRLSIKIEPSQVDMSEQKQDLDGNNEAASTGVKQTATQEAFKQILLDNQPDEVGKRIDRQSSGLIAGLFYHSGQLSQFYAPFFATFQIFTCSKKIALPRYVIFWQLLVRVMLTFTFTIASCMVYLGSALSEQEKKCIMSYDMKNTAYQCLNSEQDSDLIEGDQKDDVSSIIKGHKSTLYQMGLVCGLITASSMLIVSQNIFKSFTEFLNKVFDQQSEEKALDSEMKQDLNKANCFIKKDSEKKKSPKKRTKRQSPVKRKYESESSFKSVLDRESDSSLLHLQAMDNGYESNTSSHQVSMSTQACLLNQSERGILNLSSQVSARDNNMAAKRYPQVNEPDLLPIDEDLDDEKCSPVKPKKRTQEDSPFKKIQSESKSEKKKKQNGNYEIPPLTIQNCEKTEIFEGLGIVSKGFNLNNDLETPSSGINRQSSSKKDSRGKVSQFLSQDGTGFHLEVQRVNSNHGDHTLSNQKKQTSNQGDSETFNKKTRATNGSRNLPSLMISSFSPHNGDSDDLSYKNEAIAPHSSKNSNLHKKLDNKSMNIPLSVRNIDSKQGGAGGQFQFPIDGVSILENMQTHDINGHGHQPRFVQNFDIFSYDNESIRLEPQQICQDYNEVLPESQEKDSSSAICSKVKVLAIILVSMAFVFGICMDAYLMHNLPIEALQFILQELVAALIVDIVIQLLILVILSICQFTCELKGKRLPLDTQILQVLNSQTLEVARQIFTQYQEQSALLKIDYKDEEDLLLEKIELDLENKVQPNSLSSFENKKVIGPRDTIVKDSITKISLDGLTIEVRETLKFRPPRFIASQVSKIGIAQPGCQLDQDFQGQSRDQNVQIVLQEGNCQNGEIDSNGYQTADEMIRKQRRANIQVFERTHQFFAEQMPIQRKQIKGFKKQSPLKKGIKMLRQSIDSIEMENFDSGSYPNVKGKSRTPDKLRPNHHHNLSENDSGAVALSQSLVNINSEEEGEGKKVSQFETPEQEQTQQQQQVNLKRNSIISQQQMNEEKRSSVHKKMFLKRSSQVSIPAVDSSRELASKLISIKSRLGENHDDELSQGDDDIIIGQDQLLPNKNSSSISMLYQIEPGCADDVRGSINRSSAGFLENNHRQEAPYQIFENAAAGRNTNLDLSKAENIYASQEMEFQNNNENKIEKFSPIFSSVNRSKIEYHSKVDLQLDEGANSSFSIAPLIKGLTIDQMSKTVEEIQKQKNSSEIGNPDQQADGSSKKSSSKQSKRIDQMLSNREILEKQQSFNSARSLQDKIQLTQEKIRSSIDGSSLARGKRNLVMLDEAAISQQSLSNFGPNKESFALQMNSTILGVAPLKNSSACGGASIGNSSAGNQTPRLPSQGRLSTSTVGESKTLALVAQHNSQVVFEDCGKPDFQEEQDIQALEPKNQESHGKDGNVSDSQNQLDDKQSIHSILTRIQIGQSTSNNANNDNDYIQQLDKAKSFSDAKNSATTSAFQRLMITSKRMTQKKSSEKKYKGGGITTQEMERSSQDSVTKELRSRPQMAALQDCAGNYNEQQATSKSTQNKAIFQQPFKIVTSSAKKNKQEDNRSASDPKIKSSEDVAGVGVSNQGSCKKPVKQQNFQKSGQKSDENNNNNDISETKPATALQLSVKKELLSPRNINKGKPADMVNIKPINMFNIGLDYKQQKMDAELKSKVNLKNGAIMKELEDHTAAKQDTDNDNAQLVNSSFTVTPKTYVFKQRNFSQMTTIERLLKQSSETSSKMAGGCQKRPKANSNQDKNNNNNNYASSRTITESSLSIEQEKPSRGVDDQSIDQESNSNMANCINRYEDQRRRLESFLYLAQQSKAKKDIQKIQDMIRQIDETEKPLPMSRINELKNLQLMASPYNQSLIAMIKVELDISRKMKELKRALKQQTEQGNNKNGKSSGKIYCLPKHESYQFALEGPSTISNNNILKPKGLIQSCRSNNDVAMLARDRSPMYMAQDQNSQGICQPIVTTSHARDNSLSGRYSYLKYAGNALAQHNQAANKSVDRVRMTNGNGQKLKNSRVDSSISDIVTQRNEEQDEDHSKSTKENRFRKAVHGLGFKKIQQLQTPATPSDSKDNNEYNSTGQFSQIGLFSANTSMENQQQQRAKSVFGQIDPMMNGRKAFVKRIIGLQTQCSKSQSGKENQAQPKISK